jgi:hypothetical protein
MKALVVQMLESQADLLRKRNKHGMRSLTYIELKSGFACR